MIRHLTYLLCIISFPLFSWAQHPFYYNINTEDGLPSNEVYELLQDSFGYVWIGCDAGLFRYDGFEFKQYKSSVSKGRSMSFLELDKNGAVWSQNFAGQVFKVMADSLDLKITYEEECNHGMRYSISPDGRLWAVCGSTIGIYNLNGELIKEKTIQPKEELAQYRKNLWLGTICAHLDEIYIFIGGDGIYRYQETKDQFIQMKTSRSTKYGPTRLASLHNQLWAGYNNFQKDSSIGGYLIEILEDSLSFHHKIIKNHRINKLGQGKKGEYFFVGDFGAYYIKRATPTDSFQITEKLFPKVRTSDVLLDREGNYWFSTLDHGIYVIPSLDIKKFEAEQTKGAKCLSLSPDNNLWVGGNKGEFYYLDKDGKKNSLAKDGEYFLGAIKKMNIQDDSMLHIMGVGFVSINLQTNKIIYSSNTSYRDIFIHQDSLYYASSRGFTIAAKSNSPLAAKSVFHKNISAWSLELDSSDQKIWVSLSTGIHRYKNGQLHPFLVHGKAFYGKVLDFSDGIMWVGSVNQGIYGFQNGEIKHHYSNPEGLLSNEIKTLKVYKDWLFATAGAELYRIHIPSGKLEYFSKNLGIIAQDVEDMEVWNKRLYIASNKGLSSMPINHTAFNPIAPHIQIDAIMLGDSILEWKDDLIQLPYSHTTFRISFSSTAFRSRGNFHYEYRIPELDTNWIRLNAENNYVSFSALSAGNFKFEVRAVNENGVRSSLPATLNFSVLSPIWQQWWFFMILSLGFVGIVFLISWLRWRILTKRLALEQQLSRSQLTALKAQMNPHFMYNALNSIQDLMLSEDMRNANRYLNKFSNLMRKILNASDHDEIILSEEIELIELYLELEKLRFGKEFNYKIQLDPDLDPDQEMIASMIIQPFIENAIKHGLLHKKGDKELNISFKKENDHLKCRIQDNGVGRKKAAAIKARSQRPKSFATAATAKRLEILNAHYKNKKIGLEIIDLYDKENNALGTKVNLQLPTNIKHS